MRKNEIGLFNTETTQNENWHDFVYYFVQQKIWLKTLCSKNDVTSAGRQVTPVSYTHLTLPTILRV